MRAVALSDVGLVRKDNQDGFLACPELGLFAVADGMGGHHGGGLASEIAISKLQQWAEQSKAISFAGLVEAVKEANEDIRQVGQAVAGMELMGTTLTVALIEMGQLSLIHIGDSRAYLFRSGQLTLLTEDHSLVAELVRLGQLTPTEAENHPRRNVLTQALGAVGELKFDTQTVALHRGDRLLLCTDGLYNEVGDLLASILGQADLEAAAQQLLSSSKQRGASDNVTLVLIEID